MKELAKATFVLHSALEFQHFFLSVWVLALRGFQVDPDLIRYLVIEDIT